MRIQSLRLQNFRGFKDLEIEFPKDSNVAVFIGINGAGKSSVLDAIGLLLAQFVINLLGDTARKTERLRRAGFLLTDNDINVKADKLRILQEWSFLHKIWEWEVSKEHNKGAKEKKSFSIYSQEVISALNQDDNFNLPILVYYHTHRLSPTMGATTSKAKSYRFSQLSAFQNSFERSLAGFDDFLNWFRAEEDLENQIIVREDKSYQDPKLEVIRHAIKHFFNRLNASNLFDDLRIVRASKGDDFIFKPSVVSTLEIKKGHERLSIEQLSDGERSLLLIVADIARRLAIANPSLQNHDQILREGKGIVLIDEVDAHLHPQWQRNVIPALRETFKSCQFIVTTHSPQVLSNIERESIFILEDGKIVENNPHSYGRDTNSILYEFMGVEERPQWMRARLDHCFHLIDQGELDNAKAAIEDLKKTIGENDTEIVRANTMLAFLYD
ncbi:AAA family ATPase [Nodosilinea sp. P-1105]|uniref:AAA family ATPase n=1 Tax=Nodosilinea sp. P-1105 TaxID=2546229 RepID=UPI00146A6DAF|nr:AAA family ATPase [Nodosilinea sp. P-1105]NMF84146.1 ATP-binding protein [Nodosilinea sp. P-1105]